MNRWLEKAFQIRPSEQRRAGWLFAYAFCTAAAYVVSRSVADSLFLSRVGPSSLPMMYLISAGLVTISALAYSRVANRLSLDAIVSGTLLTLAVASVTLRGLLAAFDEGMVLIACTYLLVEIRGSLNTIQFSTMLNEAFANDNPKRMFAFCAAGSTAAGILFGACTGAAAERLGTANLLYVIAGLELLAIVPVRKLAASFTPHPPSHLRRKGRYGDASPGVLQNLLATFGAPYTRGIALLTFVGVLVLTIIGVEWKVAAAAAFVGKEDRLTSFFGMYYTCVHALTAIIQLFVTGRFLRSFGVLGGLLLFPGSMLFSTVGLLVSPASYALFWATLCKGSEIFRRTLYDPSQQILYWPIASGTRRHLIALIGGVVKPFSEAIAGLLIMQLPGSMPRVFLLLAGLLLFWLHHAWNCRAKYVLALGISVREGRLNLADATFPGDSTTIAHLEKALASTDEVLASNALELLASLPQRDWSHSVKQQLTRNDPRVRRMAVEYLEERGDPKNAAAVCLCFDDVDPAVRAAAIKAYCRLTGAEGAVDVEPLTRHPDFRVSAAALLSLVRWGGKDARAMTTEELNALVHHSHRDMRLAGVGILASVPAEQNASLWAELFDDPELNIALAAIRAAGESKDVAFIPLLIKVMQDPIRAGYAIGALARHGEAILPYLDESLRDPETTHHIRQSVAKVLRRIVSPRSLDLALVHINDLDEDELFEMLLSIKRFCCQNRLPLPEAGHRKLRVILRTEIQSYYQHLADLVDIERIYGPNLLTEALRERLARAREMVLNLVAIFHPGEDLTGVILSLRSPLARQRAIGVELLANSVDGELKPAVVAMVDDQPLAEKLVAGSRMFPPVRGDASQRIRALLSFRNDWLRAAMVHELGRLPQPAFIDEVQAALSDREYLVRETAYVALENLTTAAEFALMRTRILGSDDVRLAHFARSRGSRENITHS